MNGEQSISNSPLELFIQERINASVTHIFEPLKQYGFSPSIKEYLIKEPDEDKINHELISDKIRTNLALDIRQELNWDGIYLQSRKFGSELYPLYLQLIDSIQTKIFFARACVLHAHEAMEDEIAGRMLLMLNRLDREKSVREQIDRIKDPEYVAPSEKKLNSIEDNFVLELVRQDLDNENQAVADTMNELLDSHFVLQAYKDGVPHKMLMSLQDFQADRHTIYNFVDEKTCDEVLGGRITSRDCRRWRAACRQDRAAQLDVLKYLFARKILDWSARAHAMMQLEILEMGADVEAFVRYSEEKLQESKEVFKLDAVQRFLSKESFEDYEGFFNPPTLVLELNKSDIVHDIIVEPDFAPTSSESQAETAPDVDPVFAIQGPKVREQLVADLQKEISERYVPSLIVTPATFKKVFEFDQSLTNNEKIGPEIKTRALNDFSIAEAYKITTEEGRSKFYFRRLMMAKFADSLNARAQVLYLAKKMSKTEFQSVFLLTLFHARVASAQARLEDARLGAVEGRRYDGTPLLLDDDFYLPGTRGYDTLQLMHEWITQLSNVLFKRGVDTYWIRFVETLTFGEVLQMDKINRMQQTHITVGIPDPQKTMTHLGMHEGKGQKTLENFYKLRFTRAWCIKHQLVIKHYHDESFEKQIEKMLQECEVEYSNVKKELVRLNILKEPAKSSAQEGATFLSKIKSLF